MGSADGLGMWGKWWWWAGGPTWTSDSGLRSQGDVGWGLGSRSGGEKSGARFCSQLWRTHLAFAPAYLSGPPCPGLEEAGPNERQLWPGGSHLFFFQHQRPEKRLSSPESHDHPSWRLHRQEARSPWPAPVLSVRRTLSPFPAQSPGCGFGNFPSTQHPPTPTRDWFIPAQDQSHEIKGSCEGREGEAHGTYLTVPKVVPKCVKFDLITKEGSHHALASSCLF